MDKLIVGRNIAGRIVASLVDRSCTMYLQFLIVGSCSKTATILSLQRKIRKYSTHACEPGGFKEILVGKNSDRTFSRDIPF
jgi:hypothetical protein